MNISHITYIAIDSNKALRQVIAMFEMSRLVLWQKFLSLYLIYICPLLYMYTVYKLHFQIFIEELLQ